MRRFALILLCFAFSFAPLFAKNLSVVTTIFPAYDWAKNIALGAAADITMLLDNGVDMHSFQPRVRDIAKISTADIFVFVGGESDAWVKDAVKSAKNKNIIAVDFLDVLKNELRIYPSEHEHADEEEHAEHESREDEYDEHVWLSVKKSKKLIGAICDAFCAADPENSSVYKSNLAKYLVQLDKLDADFAALVRSSKNKNLIFADRFPFAYFAADYKLNCLAVFDGCSAETEASFNTLVFLSGKVDELKLRGVFVIENSDKKIARTIIRNSKNKQCEIFTLYTMQAVSMKSAKPGTSYISIMRENYDVMKDYFFLHL